MTEKIESIEQVSESKKYEKYFSWKKTELQQQSKESIHDALKALNEAFLRLNANKTFRTKYPHIKIDDVLPLMIKESHLNNSKKSDTWAIWYFQLMPRAVDDAKAELKKLWIKKSYNEKNPIDNCILWIMYLLHNKSLLKNELKKYSYGEEFELMSYNWWAWRVASIVESYKKENQKIWNNLNWKNFAKWLAWKLEKNSTEKKDFSNDYNVYFTNWFQKNWENDKSTILFSKWKETERGKIYQMINYVEKIKSIRETNQEKQNKSTEVKEIIIRQQKVVAQTKAQIQRLSLSIDYDKNKDQFQGDWFLDKSWYNFKKWNWYNSKYKQIQVMQWDWVISILKRAWIEASRENQSLFYDINDLDDNSHWLVSEDLLQKWAYYLLPNVEKKLEQEIPITNKTHNEKEITLWPKPDFYKWLDSLEVKSYELKWKLFILDPWHGWWDSWAIPVAKDEKWKEIPYINSDILYWNMVKNWKWDKKLHVIEAKVAMDVAYRLTKLIKEHWWEIKITHYFQNWIDNWIQTTSSNHDAPWLLDEIQNNDTWWDWTNEKFNDLSKKWLTRRVKVREWFKKNHNKKNTYFISIHADRSWEKTDLIWINILHAKNFTPQSIFAKKLADAIWPVRNMQTTYWSREKPIYVLNPRVWATDQNVLIELWNMNNENTAYVLRNWEKRQEYAEWIFKWLLKVATEKK